MVLGSVTFSSVVIFSYFDAWYYDEETLFTRPIFDSLSQLQTNAKISETTNYPFFKTTKNPVESESPNYTTSDENIDDQMVKRKRAVNSPVRLP